MDELISKTALLTHLRKERDEYMRVHFKQDPATGCWEGTTPEEEYLGDLDERLQFIEQFPGIEPVATLINNNQPGWTNIIETEPNVTIDVGTKLCVVPSHPNVGLGWVRRQFPERFPEDNRFNDACARGMQIPGVTS